MNVDETITIPLTQGLSCVVDAIDADLAGHKWHAARYGDRYYARRSLYFAGRSRGQRLHRLILERMMGRPLHASEEVDHINGDSLDNRRANLRLASRKQNARNSRRQRRNTSGRKGVVWEKCRDCWRATIQADGHQEHLGYFRSIDEAYAAYCEAARRLFGEFARFE